MKEACESLRELFQRQAVVHLVIDVQDLYCNPQHPLARDFHYDYSFHHKVALKIDRFVSETRNGLAPLWIVNGKEYIGPHSAFSIARPAGHDNPRAFCLANLYHQHPQENDETLLKPRQDAFEDTDLDSRLRRGQKKAVLLSGVTLSECVSRTAWSAEANGYEVYVIEDMVADLTKSAAEIRDIIDQRGWKRVTSAEVKSILRTGNVPGQLQL